MSSDNPHPTQKQGLEVTKRLTEIHTHCDEQIAALEAIHEDRLQCKKGCATCCVDEITVFEIEAARIRRHCSDVLLQTPAAKGRCAFLDADDACRIYEHRPYVCRSQGLPLRWDEETLDGVMVEYRDICPLNEEGRPIEDLEPILCWKIGPVEGMLASLQQSVSGAKLTRVKLRDLFHHTKKRGEGE